MIGSKIVSLKFLKDMRFMNKKYKNVIFDLGGVLVNWKPNEIILEVFKNKKVAPVNDLREIWKSDIGKNLERGLITQEEAIKKLPERYSKDDFSYFLKNVHKHLFTLEEGLKRKWKRKQEVGLEALINL